MAEDQEPRRWWLTMPAILGGLATLIGAVSGLIVALDQVGVLNGGPAPGAPETPAVAGEARPASPSTEASRETRPDAGSGFRTVELFLRADPFDYRGPCPVKIVFTGRISVAGGGGVVSYKFLRSDGASAPLQTLRFDEPGSKRIDTSWRLGAATSRFQPFSGWQAIKIYDPNERESERAAFKIYCE